MNTLTISEKFTSIQGEGQTAGTPAIFIRLSGCNILCKSEHWVCDTIEVWKKGVKTEFKDVLTVKEICDLKNFYTHLVFTGGEPLLHQAAINAFLKFIKNTYGFLPVVEVETNGTIVPSLNLINKVEYWNCSPKLLSSGVVEQKRFKPQAIEYINNYCKNPSFKFVISNSNDVHEIFKKYADYIDHENYIFMPAGENQAQLEKTRLLTVQAAMKYEVKYCDRLHIVIWNQKTGV